MASRKIPRFIAYGGEELGAGVGDGKRVQIINDFAVEGMGMTGWTRVVGEDEWGGNNDCKRACEEVRVIYSRSGLEG